jgi:hypothetical protein
VVLDNTKIKYTIMRAQCNQAPSPALPSTNTNSHLSILILLLLLLLRSMFILILFYSVHGFLRADKIAYWFTKSALYTQIHMQNRWQKEPNTRQSSYCQ